MNTVKVRFLLFFLLFLAVGQTSWAQEELKKTEQSKQAKTKPKPAPKAPMNTNTRGQTSINQEVKPLWVLNGVILQDEIDLKPEDLVSEDAKLLIASAIPGLTAESIESFRVLKDASATAVYGPRAIAGVVEVVTKKGAAGTSSFTYTNESTFRLIPTYDQYNIMNSQEQMSVIQELMQGGHYEFQNVVTQKNKGIVGRMYELFYELDRQGNSRVLNTEAGRRAYLQEAERRNTNWFKQLFQTSVMQNHTLSFSSGNEKSTYYASLSLLSDPGWQKGNKLTQYATNLNANYNLSSKVRLGLITDLSYRDQTTPIQDGYNYALNHSRTLNAKDYYTTNYAPYNIFNEMDNAYIDTDIATLRIQGQLSWKITPKIEAILMGAIRYQNNTQKTEYKENSNWVLSYRAMPNTTVRDNNTNLYKDPNDPFALPVVVLPKGGIRENTNDLNRNYGLLYNAGNYASFSYLMFKKLQEEFRNYYTVADTENNNQAFFANASYTLKGRYTANGTLRYDASNAFGPSRYLRWMPTWNAGLKWDVSQENFFASLKPLSHLSLKASFGVTAVAPSVSNSLAQLYINNPWRNSTQRELGLEIQNIANHDLTYEKNQELNIGADLGFLDDRINLSVEWFHRHSYDLIGDIVTQGTGGFTTKKGNMAQMRIRGLEIGLETTNLKTADFSWKTSFIYSRAKNEITELLTTPTIRDMIGYSTSATSQGGFARAGYPLKSIFSVPFNGLNDRGLPTFLNEHDQSTIGGIRFDSRNVDFLKYAGTLIPTDKGSFSNTFHYKGISLGVVLTYSYGNVVRLRKLSNIYTDYGIVPRELNNRWQFAGDETKTNIPVVYTTFMQNAYGYNEISQAYNTYDYSDIRIAKGDNIRLKEISLGYTFDKDFLRETRIRQLSVKLQATNLALLYADKRLNGDDPDYLVNGYTPISPKRLIFTLRVGL